MLSIDTGNLAVLYYYAGRLDEAADCYERVLKQFDAAFTEDTATLTTLLENLANVYSRQEKYEKAIETNCRAIDLRKRSIGDDSFTLAVMLRNQATYYSHLEQYEDAFRCIDESRSMHASIAKDSPYIADCDALQGIVLLRMGRREEGIALLQAAVPILREKLGDVHPCTSSAMKELREAISPTEAPTTEV